MIKYKMYLPLSLLILLTPASYAGEILSLRADSWCPFNCNPKSAQAGYMVDIVREIFKKKGITIDYQLKNWDDSKKEALEGAVQGVVGASRGDGDFAFPKQALGKYQNFIFFLPAKSTANSKSTLKFDTLEDLEGKKIGIVKDYAYGTEADQLIAKKPELFIKVSGDEPLVTLIQMLEDGKIAGLYECPQVFMYKIKVLKKNYGVFRRGMSFDKKSDDLYVAFSKKNPNSKKYVTILDQGISDLRQSGKLMRILDNYALTDWEE